MKASDIVLQLMSALAPQSDLFTDKVTITALSASGTTASATATAHGLSVGDLVSIVGSTADAAISSLTRSATIASATTSIDHDLTFDEVQIAEDGALYVTISGATEAEFNGTFKLLSVPNRTSFTFEVPDSGATTATGTPVLVDGVAFGYNGTYNITGVPDLNTFEYTVSVSGLPVASGSPVVKKNYRVSRAATLDKAIDAYTSQSGANDWLFVVTDDVSASKDRHTQSDAVANLGRTNTPRQQLIYPFSIYVFKSSIDENAAAGVKDDMLDMQKFLFKSLIGKQFNTTLACSELSSTTFVTHGLAAYDNAVYVHQFQFEAVGDIEFSDSIGYDENVAFRDVELGFNPDFNKDDDDETPSFADAKVKTTIDLDETP